MPWITATWFGNDWITLLAAVPTMTLALVRMRNGSPRWLLVWLGMLGYVAYNYCFYLFGAALNAFFPLYVAAVVLAAVLLIRALARIDAVSVVASFSRSTPVRTIGGYFTLVGVGLASVWLAMWAAYVFAGRPTPVGPEEFKVVAAVDLAVMVPALSCGGVLLWKRHSWGYIVAPIAGILASLVLGCPFAEFAHRDPPRSRRSTWRVARLGTFRDCDLRGHRVAPTSRPGKCGDLGMLWIIAAILIVHGFIHLMGFAKAFGYASLPQLTSPISRETGVLWLIAGLLVCASALLLIARPRIGWVIGAVALVLSQCVIVATWHDAWAGTLANAVLLLAVVYAFVTDGPWISGPNSIVMWSQACPDPLWRRS